MEVNYEDSIRLFTKNLPKIELHAHLNGSLSHQTLKKLIALKSQHGDDIQHLPSLTAYNLSNCFEIFELIHKITDSPEAIYLATCDVIKDFYNDGVSYLELRTTAKDRAPVMTQGVYVECVLKAIHDTINSLHNGIEVKLLLSIDRKRPVITAEETLKIAKEYFLSSDIVGIDFSGDPTARNIHSFIPILESAKKAGLKLAVHIAEVPNKFEEVKSLLHLTPDRLGHGTFLLPCKNGSLENFELFKRLNIPLEICLTSNVLSNTVSSYEDHHFKYLQAINYPMILCTDDKGVFNTSLSNEYYLAHKYYSFTKEDLFKLSFESIDHIFASDDKKKELKAYWLTKKEIS